MSHPTTKPALTIRRSDSRGHSQHGWLESRHTFSFGGYRDAEWMGFGALRVINEDVVAPGRGFGTHGHRDMEILSYVIDGALAHEDSRGSRGVLTPGDVQLMRAGTGIRHSELNGSDAEPVHFLQVWIEPANRGVTPAYSERHFPRRDGLTLLASPDEDEECLTIDQAVDVHRLLLAPGEALPFEPRRARLWLHVVRGALHVQGQRLVAGDALGTDGAAALDLRGEGAVEALLFDLA